MWKLRCAVLPGWYSRVLPGILIIIHVMLPVRLALRALLRSAVDDGAWAMNHMHSKFMVSSVDTALARGHDSCDDRGCKFDHTGCMLFCWPLSISSTWCILKMAFGIAGCKTIKFVLPGYNFEVVVRASTSWTRGLAAARAALGGNCLIGWVYYIVED